MRFARTAAVVAVVAAVVVTSCADSESTVTTGAPGGSSREVVSTEATSAPLASSTAPASTTAGAGTTTAAAPTCPAGELPASGAFDLASGDVSWLTCSPKEAFRYVVGASPDLVLISESDSEGATELIALDPADGAERWRRQNADSSIPSGPIDGLGIVVAVTDDHGTRALVGVDAASGEELWRVDAAVTFLGQSEDVAVVASEAPPGVRGIDRATGVERWSSQVAFSDLSGVGVARSAAAVLGDLIAVPTGSTLTGVDIDTGETRWTTTRQVDHPVAADGVVVGMAQRRLVAIDATDGEEMWEAPGRASYGDLLAIGDGAIVVLDPGSPDLICYELTSGEERWRRSAEVFTEPQLIDGSQVLMLWEANLGALSTADGSTVWSATPFGSPWMNSAGSNGTSGFVAINSRPWTD